MYRSLVITLTDPRPLLLGLFVLSAATWTYCARATPATEAPAKQAPAVTQETTDPATSTGTMTREQLDVAMREAEARRLAALDPDPAVSPEIAEKWGVEVLGISYAADGFWLGFRFRVTDPAKARVLFDNRIKPYVEVPGERYQLGVPQAAKVGALRTTDRGSGHNIKRGRIYNIMFSNPGFRVQPGQRVTVGAGDFKVENLTVRGNRQYLTVRQAK